MRSPVPRKNRQLNAMPAIHIALLRAKTTIPEERVETMLNSVRALRGEIRGLIDVWCGRNTHADADRFSHCIVVVAEDEEAISRYRRHPSHEPIANEFIAIEEDSVGCDIIDRRSARPS
jgi:heme-degrading monooxygenase HmoA